MIANAPYIDFIESSFINTPIIVNEYTIDVIDNNECDDEVFSFLNVCKEINHPISTEEIISYEQIRSKQICEITKIRSYIDNIPVIFAESSEQFVLSAFHEMRDGLNQLSLDMLLTDISQEEECLFMYGQKKDIKIFFNLFFEKNDVEALVNISTPKGKYVIEDNIENSIRRIFEIFQTEKIYEYIS